MRILALILIVTAAGMAQRPGPGMRQRPPGGRRALVDRWPQMTPKERERAMKNVAPERKKQLEKRLEDFNNLPPEERRELRRRYEAFSNLPPEKQQEARRLFREFNQLPQERRATLRRELKGLRDMPEGDRRTHMESEEFRQKYSDDERKMLEHISGFPEAGQPERSPAQNR